MARSRRRRGLFEGSRPPAGPGEAPRGQRFLPGILLLLVWAVFSGEGALRAQSLPVPPRDAMMATNQVLSASSFHFLAQLETAEAGHEPRTLAFANIRSTRQGHLDLTLLPQPKGVKVILQISRTPPPEAPCHLEHGRPCPPAGAAPARGNVAELQWSLPSERLTPGRYRLGTGGSTPETEVITVWHQLDSGTGERSATCARWEEATLEVKRAVHDANGRLTFLSATLRRRCEPGALFQASWWCHLKGTTAPQAGIR